MVNLIRKVDKNIIAGYLIKFLERNVIHMINTKSRTNIGLDFTDRILLNFFRVEDQMMKKMQRHRRKCSQER